MPPAAPLAAAALVLALPLAGPTATESVRYVAGTGETAVVCLAPHPNRVCVGGATFDVPEAVTDVTITLRDVLADETPATYAWTDAYDEPVGGGDFCSSATLAVPHDARHLDVFLDDLAGGEPCPEGAATAGTVEAAWS